MQAQTQALLEALSDAGLLRHWAPHILERGAALTPKVREFEWSQQGSLSAAQGRVQGGSLYRTHLTHSPGGALRGDCDCPHAAGGEACKHQAALALVWRQALSGEALTSPTAPEAASAANPGPPDEPDWAVFVRAQGAPALAERLLAWAAKVPELKRELQLWQRSSTPVEDLAQAKKLVTSVLTAPRDLYEWRRVSAYVRKAESVLGLLAGWTDADPALALGAAEHAWLKLWKLLETADDSNGEIQGLITEVGQLWLQALKQLGPQPASFAERLIKLYRVDECGYLPLDQALAAAGPLPAAKLRTQFAAAWEASRAEPSGERSTGWGPQDDYLRLLRALGDGAERLRVLRQRLERPYDHVRLIEAFVELGQAREALQAAEAACKAHPDDRRLRGLLIAAYERDGWDDEALALRQRDFEDHPANAEYHALVQAAQRCGRDPQAFRAGLWQRLMDLHAAQRSAFLAEGLAGLLVEIWTDEAEFDRAWAWLQTGAPVPISALLRLARALPASSAESAATLFKSVLARQMLGAKTPYAAALQTVRAALAVMPHEAGRLWLAWLRLEYRAKPRFVESLAGL
ncbi:SWIM zinc finger family protein [Inhella gelatinilytica]|uniref:SWIM-type domain-containing protein n=1 Tax=Inhella gelatinilytica TaxID=2795030 RepID=A0A931IY96_9BURK|nr:BTAD domain-containing putative transcriptional regulator [Inhella gelatinilytica]MBH9552218.1 hypothetical protein [Inhella gelatinilytica]